MWEECGRVWSCELEQPENVNETQWAVMAGVQNGNRNVGSQDCTHDILEENKDEIGNWDRVRLCYAFANNLALFYSCLEI